jgi:hypothetical protein
LFPKLSAEDILAKVVAGECLEKVEGAKSLLTTEMNEKVISRNKEYLLFINAVKERYLSTDFKLEDETKPEEIKPS